MTRPGSRRTLWLVRHGQTAWNAEGRWQGSRDIPLSPAGEAQARALAARFAGFEGAAFASTLLRARRTAALALGPAAAIATDPRLCELSYGSWEGMRDEDVARQWPDAHAAWRARPATVRPGDGESLAELLDRAWAGLAACAASCDGDLVVVAHGGVNRALLCRMAGLPLDAFWSLRQEAACVNVIEFGEGEPGSPLAGARVRTVNCTEHLEP